MKSYESNGPDVKIRGTAYQITEKYQILAKDAERSGNVVLAENYHQHAEHYQRIINSFAEETPSTDKQPNQNANKQAKPSAQNNADEDLGLPTSITGAPAQQGETVTA